eukprot:UN32015
MPQHCTFKNEKFDIYVWDLPLWNDWGKQAQDTQIKRTFGEFDVLVLVGCDRIKEYVINIHDYCKEKGILCIVVRNKVDKDVD